MIARICCVSLLSFSLIVPRARPACGQAVIRSRDSVVSKFIVDAREATRRYRSRQEAINDGFTRVGVEFPAMGEHWVSFARVLEDTFVASRPSVLIYVNADGAPRLAGVAYTTLLTGSRRPPAFPFAGAWHEHSGTVDEESLPLGHHAHPVVAIPTTRIQEDSPRLFILHAWIWTENPEGVFVTDNWSLPLTRLGVAGADMAPRDALRAIALADDDDEYNRLVLQTTLNLSVVEDSLATGVLGSYRNRVARDVAAIRQVRRVTTEASARLSAIWNALWLDLEKALPARAAELRRIRAQM
jgi:hypothetical protein